LEEQLNRQYITAAKQLYHHLLAPVADKLTQSLIIVPDGVLGYIPFEALLIEEVTDKYNYPTFPYLLNKHSISYTYSATLLQEMQQRQHLQKPSKELLAMAPFYAEGYSQTRDIISREVVLDTVAASSSIFSTNEFSPLPNSGIEVETISSIWTGDYFLGNDATEILFNDMASYYQILHLATHGQADYRYGDYSFLAFSQLPDSIENELLYVRDIYNLQLNADLVVLSACDAGIGELKKGEGVISLARAFAYAGAKSMVTSLWKVNDASTKDLMINLHQNLKSGMTKDQAVQQAKLKYISDQSEKDLSHPYFWGSFIAIGDMSPLTN
jgi:CHAT domain-containing protein